VSGQTLELLRGLGVCAPSAPLRVLGIDLGTTKSVCAEIIWDAQAQDRFRVRCIEVSQTVPTGEYINTVVPSVVALPGPDEVWVGEGAKRLRAQAASARAGRRPAFIRNRNIFYEVKNDIGTSRTYPSAPPGFRSPREVSAHILRYLLKSADAQDKPGIARTVVTVPASFQVAQRLDTVEAASLAGLQLREGDLLDEPLAAFLDFLLTGGFRSEDIAKPSTLLVFDFGGGTCDTAVFELAQDRNAGCIAVAPLAVSRYHRLGGGDIDRVIAHDVLIPQVQEQNGLSRFDLGYEEKKRLIEALLGLAEALKINLSTQIARLKQFGKYEGEDKSQIVATQPYVIEWCVGDKTLHFRSPVLSAQQFEKLLQPFLDRDLLYARETDYYMTRSVFAPLQDALDRSGLEPGDIDLCLMVGGSSLIPQVREAVRSFFPSAKPLAYDLRRCRRVVPGGWRKAAGTRPNLAKTKHARREGANMATHPIVLAKRRAVIGGLAAGRSKSEVAREIGVSRKTLRRWAELYSQGGEDWLRGRWEPVPRRPMMPNQIPLETELAIVDYALTHPLAGPRTIAAVLRDRFGVGCSAVYNALKRRGLENRAKRRAELDRRRDGQAPPDEVERDRLLSRQRHLKAPEPGYIACCDTAVVGRLKEAGIVHMAVAIDGHSSYGTVVLAPARNAQLAAAALERLKRELEGLDIAVVGRALTDNGTEFKGRPSHPFEALCARLGIEHRTTRVRHAWTNGKAERFIQTVKDALEEMLRRQFYRSIAELQADVDAWLAEYNARRPHQGRYNRGRPPLQVIRDFLAQREELTAA